MNREEFFKKVIAAGNYNAESLTKIQIAYWLSKDVHRSQTRDSGERYFEHPRRVAINLIEHGWNDSAMICAALLHDVVEDTNTPFQAIINLCGCEVWDLVSRLSKKVPVYCPLSGQTIGRTKKENDRYWAGLTGLAAIIKLADRLDNLRDFDTFEPERKERYIKETKEYIIPMGEAVCPRLIKSIKSILDQGEKK